MRRSTVVLYLLLFPFVLTASELRIEQVQRFEKEGHTYALLSIHWRNAWHTERHHDAVWIFFKALRSGGGYVHLRVASDGHQVIDQPGAAPTDLAIKAAADGGGFFLYPASTHRGAIHAILSVRLDAASCREGFPEGAGAYLAAYGLEMVYIPPGPFIVGDPDTTARHFGALGEGETGRPLSMTRESEPIQVGPLPGALYYRCDSTDFTGDGLGPVPAGFPKGVAGFYVMKYELTQGQYTDFLSTLTPEQAHSHRLFETPGYATAHGTIAGQGRGYVAAYPERPCHFLSWADGLAYADWAALRPWTELEYVKACRGPRRPGNREYPWGTAIRRLLARERNEEGDLMLFNDWDESRLEDKTLAVFGASYYWVMDLAGSLWERVVTIGHPAGRAFRGGAGDGNLPPDGSADTPGWPGQAGFGWRGSGYYLDRGADPAFNPFCPVALRPYAALGDGDRKAIYGQRFARSE